MKIYINLCLFLLSGSIFGQKLNQTFSNNEDLTNYQSLSRATEILEALKSPFIKTEEITKLLDDPNYHFTNSTHPNYETESKKNKSVEKTNNAFLVDSAYRWFWDTLANDWEVDMRYIFRYYYDANDNLVNYVEQYPNANTWTSFYQQIYEYDDNNNNTQIIIQYNDGTGWTDQNKYSSVYDQNNNLLSYTIYSWDGSIWVSYLELNYTYDENNNLATYSFQPNTSYSTKFIYSYVSDQLVYSKQQQFNGTDWVDQYQQFYMYDTNNDLNNSFSEIWNNNTWIPYSSTDNTYDGNHNKLSSTIYSGAAIIRRETYLYDLNNNQINKIIEAYDYFNYILNFQSQTFQDYDTDSKLTNYLYQKWNGVNWYNEDQMFYNYNQDNLLQYRIITQFNNDETIHFQDSIEFFYHININEDANEHSSSTGIENLQSDNNITVFPNPTTGVFTINSKEQISTIEIFSIVGERIYNHPNVTNNVSKEIDLTSFSKGSYLVKIVRPDGHFYSKIKLY